MPETVSTKSKKIVQQRAEACCEYCAAQAKYSHDYFSVEHIVPISLGGNNDLENLAYSCQGCNNHKYTSTEAIDPLTGQRVPLFNPRNDDWSKHFKWNEKFTEVIGATAIGRATVVRLKLNRVGLINLREVLAELKKHPPVKFSENLF